MAGTGSLPGAGGHARVVKAVHGVREIEPDPQFELDMAAIFVDISAANSLLEAFSKRQWSELYRPNHAADLSSSARQKMGSGVTSART